MQIASRTSVKRWRICSTTSWTSWTCLNWYWSKYLGRYWSKIFYLTIILVVVNAVRYQNQYYIDNDFVNKMVGENLTKMWMRNGLRQLTPWRKWEVKKEEAQMATAINMTRDEIQQMMTQSFPTILAMGVIGGIVLVELAFTFTLQAFEERAKFGISFPGMEQGISFLSLIHIWRCRRAI